MIRIIEDEFRTMSEGLAAAHLFQQAFTPIVKRSARLFDKAQRSLIHSAPEAISQAFHTMATIQHREMKGMDDDTAPAMVTLKEIDTKILRNEIENISALALPDIDYEMKCALVELPGLIDILDSQLDDRSKLARLMGICWEAGRRYGVLQAIAIWENVSTDFQQTTSNILDSALNSTLEIRLTPLLPAGATVDNVMRGSNGEPDPDDVKPSPTDRVQ